MRSVVLPAPLAVICASALTALPLASGAAEAQSPDIRLVAEARFGVLDGDPRLTFGRIPSVAADAAGRAYVLDASHLNVRIFTPEGRLVQEIGRGGRGPGELFHPNAVAVDASGRLFVLNAGNQRVEVYHPAENGQLEHQGAFRLDFGGLDMCAVGDRLFLLGPREGALLHEFTADGRRVRSFGEPPGGGEALMTATLAGGRISCDAASDRILYLPALLPEVHGFSARHGRLVWKTRIPGYDAARVRRNQDGSVSLTAAAASRTHDVGRSVLALPGGYALVQVAALRPGARNDDDVRDARTYAVTLSTGVVHPLSSPLPRLMAGSGSLAYSVGTEPWPTVTVHRITFKPGEGGR